ncbi:Os05g0136800 [Oryza sativa Japonica Group]|uniref:Os05g0136800 protein n=2 Tax=Oryza sativa subsp. japonica TaxID=39947 RepID=Q0DKX9_ORYSJ|nr:unknown protein [Oryza sativa Japonica Group]KAB8098012.1 hypothetical protein EE612_026948 [Oryza sativa]BAF16494.1 Os05g0136800 [Oryza sativa Japonica Group]BAS92158.1 Os05g0136800 [Oryza sativa Japonica Group]|eukprot:NP_001054580.1 Os05g0136800 [Oryza sativa Japonica Group]
MRGMSSGWTSGAGSGRSSSLGITIGWSSSFTSSRLHAAVASTNHAPSPVHATATSPPPSPSTNLPANGWYSTSAFPSASLITTLAGSPPPLRPPASKTCSDRTRWRSPATRSITDSGSVSAGVGDDGATSDLLVLVTVNPMLINSAS